MSGELHEVSVAIGELKGDVKSLGRSMDAMRETTQSELSALRAQMTRLQSAHDENVGSRRTMAMVWGAVGGIAATLVSVVATKLGLK
jgi:hypothetical protein